MDIIKLKRRLERLKRLRDNLLNDHYGNEMCYSYWDGHDLGYLKGKIFVIEEILDEIDDDLKKELVN